MLSLLLDLFSWSILSPSFLLLGPFSSIKSEPSSSLEGHLFLNFLSWALLLVFYSHSVMSDSLQPHELQHVRLPCPSPSPGVCSNSCPLSRWCHPTISSSFALFSFCLQSFQHQSLSQWVSSLHQVAKVFGASVSASVLQKNIQDWLPLGWTGWISLQSKGLSRVFSSTTIQKHKFFGAQLSLWSKSHPPDSSTHDY